MNQTKLPSYRFYQRIFKCNWQRTRNLEDFRSLWHVEFADEFSRFDASSEWGSVLHGLPAAADHVILIEQINFAISWHNIAPLANMGVHEN